MATWTPDPSFYPSPRMAMKAPPETLAYVAAFDPERKTPDAIAVVDVDPQFEVLRADRRHGRRCPMPATSCIISAGTPARPAYAPTRRIRTSSAAIWSCPGLRSSRIHILDTKPDPRKPKIVKVIEPEEIAEKTGYTRPHTIHCGPERHLRRGARQSPKARRPGGIFLMDHESFEPARPMGDRPRAAAARL